MNSLGKYSIFDIAGWFLGREAMTHGKLQKLCYYAYAWDQAIRNGNLIGNCEFVAWVHGPANRELYSILKESGSRKIGIADLPEGIQEIDDAEDSAFLERVWATYGSYGANALEVIAHNEMPWIAARQGRDAFEPCDNVISIDDMKNYYSHIYVGN